MQRGCDLVKVTQLGRDRAEFESRQRVPGDQIRAPLYRFCPRSQSHRVGLNMSSPPIHTHHSHPNKRGSRSSSPALSALVHLLPSFLPSLFLYPQACLRWGLRSVREQPSPCPHSRWCSEASHRPLCLPSPGLCLAICPSAVGLPSRGRKGGGCLTRDPGLMLAGRPLRPTWDFQSPSHLWQWHPQGVLDTLPLSCSEKNKTRSHHSSAQHPPVVFLSHPQKPQASQWAPGPPHPAGLSLSTPLSQLLWPPQFYAKPTRAPGPCT